MIALLLLPLALPWFLPPLARRAVTRVHPVAALRAITVSAVALAIGVLACLGALLLPVALAVPALAAVAHLVEPLRAGPRVLVLGVSAVAAGTFVVTCGTLARRIRSELRRLGAVRGDVAHLPHAGGLCVVDDPRPDAYALPGGLRGRARIVVTTGMLRALDAPEREILLAHERAHLAGRHHLFLAAVQLAGWCHPALAAVVPQVSFAAERAADEAAARATGDRKLAARAVGRAALAATRGPGPGPLPVVAPGVVTGPVPARVRALLLQAPVRRVAPVLLAMGLTCSVAAASSFSGAVLLHRGVEVAQGEVPSG
ncbi:M48 family metalloprotease [Streptomyces sp. SID486]|uniref:M56 family metallopeptidase n=1 Tax=Streptomyces sp. SID486 TaxID=2690264 RepID=UPI001371109A|nr:M56 family metallopeptidase [Streptomyces sp. SID486]MYX96596.1 M48 family metalloprotease [Streptomyces sp. SID486]